MVNHRETRIVSSVAEVANALRIARKSNALGRTIFLIGAGCSMTAGIPGAPGVARRMLRAMAQDYELPKNLDDVDAYRTLVTNKKLAPCHLGHPNTEPQDDTIDWYKVYDDMFREHFRTPDDIRELFETIFEEAAGAINWAHLCLGELVKRRYASTVLTTNFDQLALSGLVRAGIIPVVCDGVESLNRIVGAPRHPQLVELHGSRHSYLLRNQPRQVEAIGIDSRANAAVQTLFQHATTFVAIGYGGREDGIMDLLVQAAKVYPDKNLFWVSYSPKPDAISDKVRDFLATSHNGGLLLNQDADHFFMELCRELGVGAPSVVAQPLGAAVQVIEALSRSTVSHRDIQDEIQAAMAVLQRLQSRDDRGEDPVEAAIATIREARLAGDAETAYRRAKDANAAGSDGPVALRLVEETALAALDYGATAPESQPLEQAAKWFGSLLGDGATVGVETVTRWATRLGEALDMLGERDLDSQTLQAAIDARRRALASLTHERAPLDWAKAQCNLGHALSVLGERERDKDSLEEAIAAFRAGVGELPREHVPLDWAKAQQGLGDALRILGQDEGKANVLEEAILAYRAALEERTRLRMPAQWAEIQSNLGLALRALGRLTGAKVPLEEAATSFREVLEEFPQERDPKRHAKARRRLDDTLSMITNPVEYPT